MATTHSPRIVFLSVLILSVMPLGVFAQQNPSGAYVLNGTTGQVVTVGAAQQFFSDIFFGWDIARDIELVQNETGFVVGYYLLDGLGGQHQIGTVEAYEGANKPYWDWDIARDLEIVNNFRLVTDALGQVVGSAVTGQVGYYVLDGFGAPHPVNGTITSYFDDPFFRVHHDFPSAYPPPFNYCYFGWDIARDMEVSYIFKISTASGQEQIVGQVNGYYILDGYGAVHNCRVDLDGNPLMAAWEYVARPYFMWDIARDFEVTPTGDGYYLLDGMGGMHVVNASLSFGPGYPNVPPYFGWDIGKDLELVQGVNGSVIGYYVLDGIGFIHTLGRAPDLGQPVEIFQTLDIFRDLEVSPLYTPVTTAF